MLLYFKFKEINEVNFSIPSRDSSLEWTIDNFVIYLGRLCSIADIVVISEYEMLIYELDEQ